VWVWMCQRAARRQGWSGVRQDPASTSSLVPLVSARERSTQYSLAGGGLQGRAQSLVVYTSSQSHSSVEKAALLAGFGRANVRSIATDASYAIRLDALDAAIESDIARGHLPCAIVATTGTTGCTALDPLEGLAARAR